MDEKHVEGLGSNLVCTTLRCCLACMAGGLIAVFSVKSSIGETVSPMHTQHLCQKMLLCSLCNSYKGPTPDVVSPSHSNAPCQITGCWSSGTCSCCGTCSLHWSSASAKEPHLARHNHLLTHFETALGKVRQTKLWLLIAAIEQAIQAASGDGGSTTPDKADLLLSLLT